MKIALLEPLGVESELINILAKPLVKKGHTFVYYGEKTTEINELSFRCTGCDIVMIANNPFPDQVVENAECLEMLNVAFTGIDHVGQKALKAKGVTVCNAAGYSDQSVAELALGLTIGLMRYLVQADRSVRVSDTSAGLMGQEIFGKTVGIIGTGRIGIITAKLFNAFGARVIAYSRTKKLEAEQLGITYVSLEELMEQADIVSLHVPNTAATKGMIGKALLARMKPTALLINCARGPIVDNQALANALNEGRLAGAGIDVFDMEPPIPADYPLLHTKNTLLTPHVAFLTKEAMVRRAHIAFENVYAYLEGKPQNLCEL